MTISAVGFAQQIGSQGFYFGVDKERTVQTLRMLADAVEQSTIYVQSGRVTSLASGEDFTLTSVRLTFAETAQEPKADTKSLHGPDSKFPVAVTSC